MDGAVWILLILLLTGLVAGMASAMFGIGGGLLMVPVLHYGLGVEWHHATAVSLAAIALQSPYGTYQHLRRGAVDWRLGIWLAAGGLVGVLGAAWLQDDVPVRALKLGFAAVLVVAAWRMWRPMEAHDGRASLAPVIVIAVAAGVASRWFGIGGGLVTVPALVMLGVRPHVAVGSSLVAVFANAALASGVSLAQHTDLRWALALAPAALVGVPIGATLVHRMEAERLKRVFAVPLVGLAIYIVATTV